MGGGKIRDADALPEDVRKGKVFYNNQGRQVGNAEIESYKEFTVNGSPQGGGTYYISNLAGFAWFKLDGWTTKLLGIRTGSMSYDVSVKLPTSIIKGFRYNGNTYLMEFNCNGNYAMVFNDSDNTDFLNIPYKFCIYKDTIYFHLSHDVQVTILY